MTALKKYSRIALGGAIAFVILLFLLFPQRYSQSLLSGISLWAACVLPVAFPLMVFTALFSHTAAFRAVSRLLAPVSGKLFGISGAGGAICVMSALSGYPVGAKLVLDHTRKYKDRSEAFRLAVLCSVSGPSFLIGSIGGRMFLSSAAGWIALVSHLLGVWLICLLFRRRSIPRKTLPVPERTETQSETQSLADHVMQSVLSVLCVGGFIALFSVLLQMLTDLRVFSVLSAPFQEGAPTAEAFLSGLLEMTSGCAQLARSPSPFSLALCVFLVTMGGACVLAQQFAYLSQAGIRFLPFVAVKTAQATLAALLAYLLALFCGI